MARTFYGSYQGVVYECRPIKIGTSAEKVIKPDEVEEYWLPSVSDEIDAILVNYYQIPLKKVQRGQESIYPYSIDKIANKWAAAEILKNIFSEIEPMANDRATTLMNEARAELDKIIRNEIRLVGQRRKSPNHFLHPSIRGIEKIPPTV